jgi:twitching motility protein PilT
MQTSVRDGMITMEKSLEELVKNGKIDQSAAREGH